MKRKLKRRQPARNGLQYIIYPETRKELTPLTFFDAGISHRKDDGLFIGMHPHSGIGIITYFEGGNLSHDDSGNNREVIRDGGVQWIRAGGGVWHQENYLKKESQQSGEWDLTIHQLWLQLPPKLEESEVEYQNFQPEDLPVLDNVKIIIGTYKGLKSPLNVPYSMTYLDVHLKAGEQFEFKTPEKQTTGFIFPRKGQLNLLDDELALNHIGILEENEGTLQISAQTDAEFVLVMTEPKDYPILAQGGSVHTNAESMRRSFARIREARGTVRL